jgi:hypothetical protein
VRASRIVLTAGTIVLTAGTIMCLAAAAGCASADPRTVFGATVARAGYVEQMLGNYSGVGALGGDSLDQVVTEYGGGYVLSESQYGRAGQPDDVHVAVVVLGVGAVSWPMQGENYTGPAGITCYRFRIAYPRAISYAPIACPAPSGQNAADAAWARWTAGYDLASGAFTTYSTRPVPGSLAAAIRLLARADQDMLTAATPVTGPDGHLTSADFAAGATSTEGGLDGPRIAALAVPLSNGTCAYAAFSSKVLTDSTSQTLEGEPAQAAAEAGRGDWPSCGG